MIIMKGMKVQGAAIYHGFLLFRACSAV